MSKIICDICGTVYQDTAESCPICGYTNQIGMEELDVDMLEDISGARGKGGRFSSASKKKHKEIFDYDEVNADELDDEEEDPYEDSEAYEQEPKSNTLLVVLLVIIIALLLLATGFLFFRYFLPNAFNNDEAAPTTIATVATEPEETTEPAIPCTDIVLMSGGKVELCGEGFFHVLHVKVVPEDTTDVLTYRSEDESVATVNEDGRITAVGEGETTIYINCGEKQIKCPVTVVFEEVTEPETEATETIEGQAETGAEEETVETATETTVPEETLKDVTLKLKHKDRSINVGYGFQLELACDLEPEEVEWSVEDSKIATVDEKGFVKAVRSGTTVVTAKYGDQEVKCTIRCR